MCLQKKLYSLKKHKLIKFSLLFSGWNVHTAPLNNLLVMQNRYIYNTAISRSNPLHSQYRQHSNNISNSPTSSPHKTPERSEPRIKIFCLENHNEESETKLETDFMWRGGGGGRKVEKKKLMIPNCSLFLFPRWAFFFFTQPFFFFTDNNKNSFFAMFKKQLLNSKHVHITCSWNN